jgi:flagellar basal-body rod protein FlgB
VNVVPEFDPLTFSEAALKLRSYRQQILSSNLTNADTPGYKARDVAFSQVLDEQLQGTHYQSSLRMKTTDSRHLGASAASGDTPPLLYRTSLQSSLDGNTVDPDEERSRFAENTLHIEAALNFLGSTIKTRISAITGQNS